MNDILMIAPVFGAGIVLGCIFYGGLWLTVSKGLSSAHAHWWFLGSFWLRLIIALGGFYIITQGQLENLLACFAGFMLARIAVSLLTRAKESPHHAA